MVLLVWAALFRNWTIRDWLMLGELSWKPWRIGYYSKAALSADKGAAGKRDIDQLEEALQYLVSTGATMLPDTVKLQVEFPQKSGSGGDGQHQSLATFMADEMSKAALGSTLTVQQGKTGAMALGNVHAGTTRTRRDAGLRAVSGCLRRDLVTPFVRLNYGAGAKVPQLRLVPDEEIDMSTLAQAVNELAGAGLPVSVSWVLKKLGAPMPKPGDLVLGNPTPAAIPLQDAAPARPRRMRVRTAQPFQLAA
jgi:phage gp29-like protein